MAVDCVGAGGDRRGRGLLALQSWPGVVTLLAWLVVGGLRSGWRWCGAAVAGVGQRWSLLLVELTFASFRIEHTRPTAPEAITSLRTAPADLLVAGATLSSVARYRCFQHLRYHV